MRRFKRRLRRRLIELVVALLVIGGGVGLATAGIAGPAPRRSQSQYLDRTESKYAELHQRLQLHRVCTDTGRWGEWPCDQFSPAERP